MYQVRIQVRHGCEHGVAVAVWGGGGVPAFSALVSAAPVSFWFSAYAAPVMLSAPALGLIPMTSQSATDDIGWRVSWDLRDKSRTPHGVGQPHQQPEYKLVGV